MDKYIVTIVMKYIDELCLINKYVEELRSQITEWLWSSVCQVMGD